jgi:phosphoserine phosphatase RsbX
MATLSVPPIIEYGVAAYALPGQSESGDRHLIRHRSNGVLVAAIDGLGHGDEAAAAARLAVSVLENSRDESVISLLQRCHQNLRGTRGVVMSMAFIDASLGHMTWIGVGNVQGLLLRHGAIRGSAHEELLLRAGVVGAQLPPLQAAVLPLTHGDALIFATDGVRSEFSEDVSALEPPQKCADRVLAAYCRKNDDALVVVTRYRESYP